MEEKKVTKLNLSTILLIIAIIIIIIMAYIIFALYNKPKVEKEEAIQPKNQSKIQVQNVVTDCPNPTTNSSPKNSNEYKLITKELEKDDYLYVTDVEKDGEQLTFKGVLSKAVFFYENSRIFLDILAKKEMEINGETYQLVIDEDDDTHIGLKLEDEEGFEFYLSKNDEKYYLCSELGEVYVITDEKMKITVDLDSTYSDVNNTLSLKEAWDYKDGGGNYTFRTVMKGPLPSDNSYIINGSVYKFDFEDGKCIRVINNCYWV